MEDADLALRLGKVTRMHIIDADVETSARRWFVVGKIATSLLNNFILLLFVLGVSTSLLKQLYYGAPKLAEKW